jgi:hypothetical protein
MTSYIENMEVEPGYYNSSVSAIFFKHSKLMEEVEERFERIENSESKKKVQHERHGKTDEKLFECDKEIPLENIESGNKTNPLDSIETTEDIPIRITCHPKWNSKMRSKELGCLEFGVTWREGDHTIEPIWNLIDISDKSVNEKLYPLLNFYHSNTLAYPNTKRQCWFCKRLCNKGKDICYVHSTEMNWMYSAITPDIPELDTDSNPTDAEDFTIVDPLGIKMIGLSIN